MMEVSTAVVSACVAAVACAGAYVLWGPDQLWKRPGIGNRYKHTGLLEFRVGGKVAGVGRPVVMPFIRHHRVHCRYLSLDPRRHPPMMKGFGVIGYETVTYFIPAGRCAGLVNLGNTCFLNAILQVSFCVYLGGVFCKRGLLSAGSFLSA